MFILKVDKMLVAAALGQTVNVTNVVKRVISRKIAGDTF
jgi:hypothetical protein